jgi:hypothetical protein
MRGRRASGMKRRAADRIASHRLTAHHMTAPSPMAHPTSHGLPVSYVRRYDAAEAAQGIGQQQAPQRRGLGSRSGTGTGTESLCWYRYWYWVVYPPYRFVSTRDDTSETGRDRRCDGCWCICASRI